MNLSNIIELVYFISAGPILAILIALGLWQLKISKDNARMTAKRESYKLAAEQCIFYLSHITPLQNKLDIAIKNNNVKFFEKAVLHKEGNVIRVKYNHNKNDIKKLLSISPEFLDVANSMEAFSLFFISGVADERVAFSSVGTTFCYTAREQMIPLLTFLSVERDFENLTKLFLLWDTRLESERLIKAKQIIEDKLKMHDDKRINPLGTD